MRIPEQPPNKSEVLHQKIDEARAALTDSDYQTLVKDCQKSYRHWQKVKYVTRQRARELKKHLDPELVWMMMAFAREPQYRLLPFRGVSAESVKYTVPDFVQREMMQIDRELAGTLIAGDEKPVDPSQRERFIVNAFREEAIASSMLEGAATTRKSAKEMLRTGRKPRSRGERMVLNNYKAIQFIRQNRNQELSTDFLIELQRILTIETLDEPDQSGRLRRDDDEIVVADELGEVLHSPPASGELPERLETLCKFANQSEMGEHFIHPLIRGCALHFQLGVDHPFCDGNGRTARAVFYWYMLRSGYWLFEYLPISRLIYRSPAKYARAFLYSETDDYDFTYFLMYKSRIILKAREDLKEYLLKKQRELALARRTFAKDTSLNHRQRELIIRVMRNPDRLFTIAGYMGEFNVSYGTANNDLSQMVEGGYLEQRRSGNRYEYMRGPKLDAIESDAV